MKNNEVKNPVISYNVLGNMGDDTTEYQIGRSNDGTVAVKLGTAKFEDDGDGNIEIPSGGINGYYRSEEIDEIIEEVEGSFDVKLENYYTKEETYSNSEIDTKIAEAESSAFEAAKQYTNDAVGGITSFETEIVEELPATGEKGTIYLVPKDDSQDAGYNEYIYVNNAWEIIGDTDISLDNYYTKATIDSMLDEYTEKFDFYNTISSIEEEISGVANGAFAIKIESTLVSSSDPVTVLVMDNIKLLDYCGYNNTKLTIYRAQGNSWTVIKNDSSIDYEIVDNLEQIGLTINVPVSYITDGEADIFVKQAGSLAQENKDSIGSIEGEISSIEGNIVSINQALGRKVPYSYSSTGGGAVSGFADNNGNAGVEIANNASGDKWLMKFFPDDANKGIYFQYTNDDTNWQTPCIINKNGVLLPSGGANCTKIATYCDGGEISCFWYGNIGILSVYAHFKDLAAEWGEYKVADLPFLIVPRYFSTGVIFTQADATIDGVVNAGKAIPLRMYVNGPTGSTYDSGVYISTKGFSVEDAWCVGSLVFIRE